MSASVIGSSVAEQLNSSIPKVNFTEVANDKVPPFVRMVRFTTRLERLLFRRTFGLILRLSGLQTVAHIVSDALGLPAPQTGAAAVEDVDVASGPAGPQTWTAALWEAFEMGNIRSLGGMLNFLLSRWVLACLAMVCECNSPTKFC